MTRLLTLEERVLTLDKMTADANEAWEHEHGGTVRGKPPYGSVEGRRSVMRLWFGDKVDDDEFLHTGLDNLNVPRTTLEEIEMDKVLTLDERWAIQRQKETTMQAEVNEWGLSK